MFNNENQVFLSITKKKEKKKKISKRVLFSVYYKYDVQWGIYSPRARILAMCFRRKKTHH